MNVRLRLRFLWHDVERKIADVEMWFVRRFPGRLQRNVLVAIAVEATSARLIGPHAYAGPDGLDFERLWWATRGELPPHRVDEIRRPVEDVPL